MPEQVQEDATFLEQLLPRRVRFFRLLWKVTAFLGTVIVLGTIASLIATWLTSPNGVIPTNTPLRQLFSLWPITLPLGCCILLLALLTKILSRGPLLTSSPAQKNRTRMLERLRNTYDTMLAQTLEENAWIDVNLSEKPDMVQNAATLLLRLGNQPERLLPAGTSILDTYDQAAQDLLILGEPGTGKSTLLLKLAQQLVERAASDAEHPLPVILPLSSWAVKRSSLQDWMVDQIAQTYHIPRYVSEQWVREGTILPLLDGLDEMNETARLTRIAEINRYHQTHLGLPLVVCSRTAEYNAASKHKRLILQRALVVQPLTNHQVNAYLLQSGEKMAALLGVIKKNPALQKLATTPLMLNILMLTYQGTPVHELPRKQDLLQQQVWTDYITQMVERKGNKNRYPLEQTCRWLIWLAQQMREHQQPIFSLEQLQPDWLPKQWRAMYKWSVGLFIGLGTGLVLGMGLGLAFTLGLGPTTGLIVGLGAGLGAGLVSGLGFGLQTMIEPVEVLTWSWKDIRSGLGLGLSPVLPIGLAVALGLVIVHSVKLDVLLVSGLAIVLNTGLNRGFSGKQLPERKMLSPNEGIRRSFKHGLLILVTKLGLGLLFGLGFGLAFGPGFGLIVGLGFGLGFGLIMGLIAGLGAALQHYILRLWLWRIHSFPLKVVPFLEDATTRILLRRKFGGYSFSHKLLLDYFADMNLAKVSVTSISLPLTGDQHDTTYPAQSPANP